MQVEILLVLMVMKYFILMEILLNQKRQLVYLQHRGKMKVLFDVGAVILLICFYFYLRFNKILEMGLHK